MDPREMESVRSFEGAVGVVRRDQRRFQSNGFDTFASSSPRLDVLPSKALYTSPRSSPSWLQL